MFIKRLHSCIGGLALGLVFISACGGGVCDNKIAGCIALQVTENYNGDPVYVEILDAFGHRLDLRYTDPQPRDLVEVPLEGGYDPSAARCLRVWVGSGQNRKTAILNVSNWFGGRTPVSLSLQSRQKMEQFSSPLRKTLPGLGRSVAIGRVPGALGGLPMLLVGSFNQAAIPPGAVEFFQVDSTPSLTPNTTFNLGYEAAPYPLALSGNSDQTAMLVVGADPLEGAMIAPFTPPRVFRRQIGGGSGFDHGGIPLPSAVVNAQTTFVAATFLDGTTDVVTNWFDKATNACGTTIQKSPDFMFVPSANIPRIGSEPCNQLSALALADINNDERPDILRSIDGTVTASLRNSDGTFAPAVPVVPDQKMTLLGLTIGDLNGDQKADLAVAVNSDPSRVTGGKMVIASMGPLVPLVPIPPMPNPLPLPTTFPRAAVTVDVNGDFLDDIVVASFGFGTGMTATEPVAGIWGDSQSISADRFVVSPMAPNLFDIAAGDLDGDCRPDLAVVAFQSNQVYVFLNRSFTVQQQP